jgi:hypothetical protein
VSLLLLGLFSDDVLQKDAALAVLGYIYFREDTCASAARLLTQHVLPIARDPTVDVLLRARVRRLWEFIDACMRAVSC